MTGSVLIVDDQAAFRTVARALVQLLAHWSVVAEADSGEEAIAAVARAHTAGTPVDVVVMDINLPGISGIAATRIITTAHPEIRVVLVSTYAPGDLPADAADCGAVAYLRKEDVTPDRLRAVVGPVGA